jgi:carbohydrate-selective porin OprB
MNPLLAEGLERNRWLRSQPYDGGEFGFEWGLNGAVGVFIPAEVDWNVALGQQQLLGIYKIGGSYDTASLPDWLTAINGMSLPLTTAPPRNGHRESRRGSAPAR